jgi:hypothetical protein
VLNVSALWHGDDAGVEAGAGAETGAGVAIRKSEVQWMLRRCGHCACWGVVSGSTMAKPPTLGTCHVLRWSRLPGT